MKNDNLEFDGHCALALSLGKSLTKTNGQCTMTKNGRTFAFIHPIARLLFRIFPNSIEKAEKNWNRK